MPDSSDITADEILRRMIRDRIGSTDLEAIKVAEDCRNFMNGLSGIQRAIEMLDEAIRRSEDPGESEQLAPEQVTQLRELVILFTELRADMDALVVTPWKAGYESGWEGGASERKQVLATVIDLTSRLRG